MSDGPLVDAHLKKDAKREEHSDCHDHKLGGMWSQEPALHKKIEWREHHDQHSDLAKRFSDEGGDEPYGLTALIHSGGALAGRVESGRYHGK